MAGDTDADLGDRPGAGHDHSAVSRSDSGRWVTAGASTTFDLLRAPRGRADVLEQPCPTFAPLPDETSFLAAASCACSNFLSS
jgi:hypothetical protein